METSTLIEQWVEWTPRGLVFGPPARRINTSWFQRLIGNQRVRFSDGTERNVHAADLSPLRHWPHRDVERMFSAAEAAIHQGAAS